MTPLAFARRIVRGEIRVVPVVLLGGLLLGLRRWPLLVVLVLGWTAILVVGEARRDEPVTVEFVRDVALFASGNAFAGGLIHESFVLLRYFVRGLDDALRRLFR